MRQAKVSIVMKPYGIIGFWLFRDGCIKIKIKASLWREKNITGGNTGAGPKSQDNSVIIQSQPWILNSASSAQQ